MTKYLDYEGLRHFWGKIKKWVSEYVYITYDEDNNNIVSKTVHVGDKTLTINKWALESTPPNLDDISEGTTNKHFTATDKSKLSGILAGAEVNQNAFSNVKVGSSTIAADTKTDTLELVAGSNVTLTPDATNDKVTISVSTGAIPDGSSTTPKMDGTAAVGTETTWAHGDHVHPTDTSRAPKNHASSDTTYGKGTTSNYGHVKLSDSISSTSAAASGGIAATPKAVNDVKNLIPTISYDSTNNKIISTVNGTSTDIVTAETLASAADRIFWVTPNVTTGTEIIDAFENNKVLICKVTYNGEQWMLPLGVADYNPQDYTGAAFVFTGMANNKLYSLVCTKGNGSNWDWTTTWNGNNLEDASNKKSSITGSELSNTSFYPTNYAVVQYISDVLTDSTNGYIPLSLKGQANGVATLDNGGKIPLTQLPSYVDDVVEVYKKGGVLPSQITINNLHQALSTTDGGEEAINPESGVIYILMEDISTGSQQNDITFKENSQFRWGGTTLVLLIDNNISRIIESEITTVTNDTSIPVS